MKSIKYKIGTCYPTIYHLTSQLCSWFSGDHLFFEVGCKYLYTDMFATSEEKSSTNGGVQEYVFFLFCKFEYILENIDRCWRLLEEELYR